MNETFVYMLLQAAGTLFAFVLISIAIGFGLTVGFKLASSMLKLTFFHQRRH